MTDHDEIAAMNWRDADYYHNAASQDATEPAACRACGGARVVGRAELQYVAIRPTVKTEPCQRCAGAGTET